MILEYVLNVKCDLATNPRIWGGGGGGGGGAVVWLLNWFSQMYFAS